MSAFAAAFCTVCRQYLCLDSVQSDTLAVFTVSSFFVCGHYLMEARLSLRYKMIAVIGILMQIDFLLTRQSSFWMWLKSWLCLRSIHSMYTYPSTPAPCFISLVWVESTPDWTGCRVVCVRKLKRLPKMNDLWRLFPTAVYLREPWTHCWGENWAVKSQYDVMPYREKYRLIFCSQNTSRCVEGQYVFCPKHFTHCTNNKVIL